jgi:tetratricopeptide (TPR) repeat protein
LLLALFMLSGSIRGSDAESRYAAAGKAYEQKDYAAAITAYDSLLKDGYRSSDLFYNLGNAHYKAGNIGRAVLNYEKALKLSPDDDDIRYNLRIANLKVVDKIDAIPAVFYRRWLNTVSGWCSPDTWSWWLIAGCWLLAGTVFGFVVSGSSGRKKLFFLAGLLCLLLVGFTALAGWESHRLSTQEHEAVVLAPSVYVKSAPDEKGNDLFILHEGTKVSLLDRVNGWQEIRLANGSVGWVTDASLEAI